MKTVTALLPCHNEAEHLVAVLDSVKAQTYPIERIIVVADACSDDTAEIARNYGGIDVVETDCKDKSVAQNAVVHSVTSEFLVGWDGDTFPEPDCLELMMVDIEKHGHDATCATVLPVQPRGFYIRARRFAYALGRRWWRLCQAIVGRIQVLTGAAYLFRTEAIQSIGGFSEGLLSGDMPTTWELMNKGYKCGYAGDAVALTYDPETFGVYTAQMRRWSSGYFQTMIRHRRQLWHWRSVLVVWTAIFDLISLFWAQIFTVYAIFTHKTSYLIAVGIWTCVHWIVTTTLVTTVVGFKEAILGVIPYTLVNLLNKFIYFWAGIREVVLGKRYLSWTGRQGRSTEIGPMSDDRKNTLAVMAVGSVLTAVAWYIDGLLPAGIEAFLTVVALTVMWMRWRKRVLAV